MVWIPSIESMLLHRQLRWLGHVIRMPHSRLPNCVLYGQLRLGHRSVGGQKKLFKDHIKSILRKGSVLFNRLKFLASIRATWRSTCALGMCFTSMLNAIELQLSDAVADTSMLQCSTQFLILFINAHFVADNASHVLASSATVRPTFKIEKEVVVIFNGWTSKK